MTESRVSQLLSQSRSRHEVVRSPDLIKISRAWQQQKRKSRESNQQLRKMIREMRYLQSLNSRLSRGVLRRRKDLRVAESIRQRYNEDVRRKQRLQQLRRDQMMRNRSAAIKIKQQRLNRVNAVKRSLLQKESVANYYRSQGSQLRSERLQNQLKQYSTNKSRVERVIEFECNLRESAIRKKESDNTSHIQNYRKVMEREREAIKMRQLKSLEVKEHMKALTESSTQRLKQISDLSDSIKKFRSPYLGGKRRKEFLKGRCATEKNYSEAEHQTTVFISHCGPFG